MPEVVNGAGTQPINLELAASEAGYVVMIRRQGMRAYQTLQVPPPNDQVLA